jgi:elongation factor P
VAELVYASVSKTDPLTRVWVRVPPCPPRIIMQPTALKTGTIFKQNGHPYQVEKYTHTKVARGGATVRVKARNLITGNIAETSFNSSAKIEDADVTRSSAQYLYNDGSGFVFMNPVNYEQFQISTKVVGDMAKFLKEGESVRVLYFEDKPVAIELPKTMVFKVKYTEPGFKGNTATNTLKEATFENGTIVKVPTFIAIGDKVKINTDSGTYVARA